jgi:hypothetical protein
MRKLHAEPRRRDGRQHVGIYTVFEEEFWHNRYAQRDLAQLEAATQDPPQASPQHQGNGKRGAADR